MVLQGCVWLVSGFDDRVMYAEYLRHHALEVEEWETPELALHQFETSRPNVITIPKSNSVVRVEENCQASGWRLSPVQIQFLDAAFS